MQALKVGALNDRGPWMRKNAKVLKAELKNCRRLSSTYQNNFQFKNNELTLGCSEMNIHFSLLGYELWHTLHKVLHAQ